MANSVGKPLKFKSVNQLRELADRYFADTPESEWTITGLALALDTTRETLMDYQAKDEYSYTIKKYKLMIHSAYEKDLRAKGRSGDIFALKNFGWTDKQEIEHSGEIGDGSLDPKKRVAFESWLESQNANTKRGD